MQLRERNLILLIRLGNLLLASLALLVSFMAEAGCHSALSSSPPRIHHGPITLREIVIDLVAIFWFVGAIRLFSRGRLGWIGSLIGTGASICAVAVSFVVLVGSYVLPNAEMVRFKEDSGGPVYVATLIHGVIGLLILLAIPLGLLIGLLKMRKDLA
jgi:hypothetical protein